MRLTPSWLRSSSATTPDDRSAGPDVSPDVTIYHAPTATITNDESEQPIEAGEFVPDADSALVAVLDGMHTPVTVDEVADRLVRPKRPSLDTWANVHEQLHQHRLPALDADGVIEFDAERGVVDLPEGRKREGGLLRTVLTIFSIGAVLAFLVAVSLPVVTALPV